MSDEDFDIERDCLLVEYGTKAGIEIERMRAEIERLTALAQSNDDITWELTGENVRLRGLYDSATDQAVRYADDNERLRALLRDGVDVTMPYGDDGTVAYWRANVRRALEQKP